MKNRIRKMFAAILTMILFSCGASPIAAGSLIDDVKSQETDADHAADTSYSLLRGNNLNYGTTQITKLASNKVNISGFTQCHHECDKVYLELYLEQKKDGSYATYKSWEFTENNVTHLSKSINVIVPSGHYYRVRGYHAAKDGSKESTTTLTSGVLVK